VPIPRDQLPIGEGLHPDGTPGAEFFVDRPMLDALEELGPAEKHDDGRFVHMADKLTEYLQQHPCKGFRPVPFYSEMGDFVTFHARGERCYERRIDDLLTVYLSMETKELAGCKADSILHSSGGLFAERPRRV
jgi:hypothetical protein